MGIGFHQYVVTLRLQRATTLLVTSTKSIKEISYDVGFRAPEVFSKAFKRCMGCSPTTYRVHHLPFYETPVRQLADSEVATNSLRTRQNGERSDWFDLISDCWEDP
jgi:AraC-like DNA-binding protein